MFFEDFFQETVRCFYNYSKPKLFNNYHLWACDSTVQILPDSEATRKIGVHKNQHKSVASIKISTYFDVFSKVFTNIALCDKRISDIVCCLTGQIQKIPNNTICVYDRGYGSQIIPFFHDLQGSKYVIRLRTNYSKEVIAFMKDAATDITLTIPLSERTYKRLKDYLIERSAKDLITFRLIKVVLSTGEIEVLITNLGSDFSTAQLTEIYHLRWGIETAYNGIKSHQMLGTFSGYSELAIFQDIWCNFIFYNLQTITMLSAHEGLKRLNKKRTQQALDKGRQAKSYKINRNVGTNTMRQYLIPLLFGPISKISKLLNEMIAYYLQSIERIKSNDKPRERKRIRNNDRHITEKNYKRGF